MYRKKFKSLRPLAETAESHHRCDVIVNQRLFVSPFFLFTLFAPIGTHLIFLLGNLLHAFIQIILFGFLFIFKLVQLETARERKRQKLQRRWLPINSARNRHSAYEKSISKYDNTHNLPAFHFVQRGPLHSHGHAHVPLMFLAINVIQIVDRILHYTITHFAIVASLWRARSGLGNDLRSVEVRLEVNL